MATASGLENLRPESAERSAFIGGNPLKIGVGSADLVFADQSTQNLKDIVNMTGFVGTHVGSANNGLPFRYGRIDCRRRENAVLEKVRREMNRAASGAGAGPSANARSSASSSATGASRIRVSLLGCA